MAPLVLEIREYLTPEGDSPFGAWLEALDPGAAAKVVVAVTRIENGNLSNAKSVGSGVLEFRIDFGPGYRIYFGRDGATVVILLAGGTKKRQQRDVDDAKARWQDYKRRRKGEI